MTDLRKEIGGVDKIRITSEGEVLSKNAGETQIGKTTLKW